MAGRLIIGIAALCVGWGSAVEVQAASFDCAKAQRPFEKAICNDPALSQQDDVLAVAYATAIGGLSDPARTTMRAGQRAWLGFAQSACTATGQPLDSGDYTDDGLACLRATFAARIAVLEISRMQGGYRFYLDASYQLAPDPNAEKLEDYRWTLGTKIVSGPRLDGGSELATAFNGFAGQIADASAAALWEDPEDGEPDGSFDEDIALTIAGITPARISLRTTSYWYGHGAAHGNYSITYGHFLIDAKRDMQANDLFTGAQWREKLLDLVHTQLVRQIGEDLQLDDINDIAQAVASPERWSFSDAGLVVQFQPYEVSYYAYGAPTVTVNWTGLEDILAPGAETIYASL